MKTPLERLLINAQGLAGQCVSIVLTVVDQHVGG